MALASSVPSEADECTCRSIRVRATHLRTPILRRRAGPLPRPDARGSASGGRRGRLGREPTLRQPVEPDLGLGADLAVVRQLVEFGPELLELVGREIGVEPALRLRRDRLRLRELIDATGDVL